MAKAYVKDDFTPWVEEVKAELTKFKRCRIKVGILGQSGGELLRIAFVHEFGMVIKPKHAKNLAIPLKKSMRGKSPLEVKNTYPYTTKEGQKLIMRDVGKDKVEALFLLLPSVTIPERSFLRAGYDSGKPILEKAFQKSLKDIIYGRKTAEQAAHYIGSVGRSIIQKYLTQVGPPKSRITLASNPGKTETLRQSGDLWKAIQYEVTGI